LRYKLYKQMRQKQKYEPNRYNNDLFTVKQEEPAQAVNATMSMKGNYEGDEGGTHSAFRRYD